MEWILGRVLGDIIIKSLWSNASKHTFIHFQYPALCRLSHIQTFKFRLRHYTFRICLACEIFIRSLCCQLKMLLYILSIKYNCLAEFFLFDYRKGNVNMKPYLENDLEIRSFDKTISAHWTQQRYFLVRLQEKLATKII